MDIVIPYVDMTDLAWQDQFLKTRHIPVRDDRGRELALRPFRKRFDSYGLFKYWWRALEANFQDDFTVHLLLSGESQYPSFLKSDKRIVPHYHRDFIPAHKLPCFDSCTIELCAIHVLDLSPVFLLANDDMYFNSPCSRDDFCEGDTPLTKIALREKYGNGMFQRVLENGRQLVSSVLGEECPTYAWHHLIQAYQGKFCKELLNRLWPVVSKCMGQFRHDREVNHLMLMMAQDLAHVSKDSGRYPADGYFDCPKLKEIPFSQIRPHKVICLNDTDSTGLEDARRYLEWRYPEKSTFEL